MLQAARNYWNRLSRTGLNDDEGIFGHREIILLNKILVVSPVIIALMIPLEIFINGYDVVPLELLFMGLMLFGIVLQKLRYFWLNRLYLLITANTFITIAGAAVGKGCNNHIPMIPIMLFGMILFKTTRDRILVFIMSLGFYLLYRYLLETVEPVYHISEANKEKFTSIFFVISLLFTFLLGYYFLNINLEYESVIVGQNISISHKNKEITDSINYAQRIQQAKLPDRNLFHSSFRDSFILFRPKDIVSGDFYYFHEREGIIFLAVADCTGHGVPGALMSMIGYERLNDAVSRHNDPAAILKDLNIGLKASLRQDGTIDSTRDGMDIAFCAFDKSRRILRYAGANRPLWIMRSGTKEMEETGPTKTAIGGLTANEAEFRVHELNLSEGDSFYLFSDGFADQFGGDKGKKLTTKQFRELLLSISDKPMGEKESHLRDFIDQWKGNSEQIDDILVMGIRV